MLINEDVIKKIRETYKDRFNAIVFKIAGAQSLTPEEIQRLIDKGLIEADTPSGLLSDAYHISRIRSGTDFKDRPKTTLPKFRDDLKRLMPTLGPRENFAIQHIKATAGNYITALRDKALSNIEGSIRDHNYQERNKMIHDVIRPTLEEGVEGAKVTVKEIASRLRERTGDMYRDWKRVAVTEVSNALNLGAADAILDRNSGQSPQTVYVYKIAHLDSALCPYCRAFYLEPDGITPKVYSMSELMANGSNYGRKTSSWKPCIGATHPNERCELVELPLGYGFEPGSNRAHFIDKDFVWYNRKKQQL